MKCRKKNKRSFRLSYSLSVQPCLCLYMSPLSSSPLVLPTPVTGQSLLVLFVRFFFKVRKTEKQFNKSKSVLELNQNSVS